MTSDTPQPLVVPSADALVEVSGTFYRAVDPRHRATALAGSLGNGRYSCAEKPALYLSSSPEGVAAAMIKHADARVHDLEFLTFEVRATRIADLRDHAAMSKLGIDPALAAGDWQGPLAAGSTPDSWRVRERLQEAGALGLIDPSRKKPGLWHLTLFAWNEPEAPRVAMID